MKKDIDECTTGTEICGSNERCDNTIGNYTCTCKFGYNGTPCSGMNEKLIFHILFKAFHIDIDECADGTGICGENEHCNNTIGSYTCICNAGFSGAPCTGIT